MRIEPTESRVLTPSPPLLRLGKPMDMRRLGRSIGWRREIAADQRALAERLAPYRAYREACPICSQAGAEPYVTVFDYEYRCCVVCGHLFCATPPDAAAVRRLYESGSADGSVQRKIYLDERLFARRVEEIAQPKVAFVEEVLTSIGESRRGLWIDVGSGAGEVLVAARAAGWSARGIESDESEAMFARARGLDVEIGYLDPDAAESALMRGAGIVSMFNVLEHVGAPGTLLRAVRAADPIAVVFEVPRHPSLSSLSAELFPDMACRHIYPPDHLHVFSDESLNRLTESAGLEVVAQWRFGQDAFDLIFAAAASTGRAGGQGSVLERVAAAVPALQEAVDANGLSDTVVVVATPR